MYDAGVQSNPGPTLPSRPRQVKTVAVLLIVFGVLGLLLAFLMMSIVSDSAGHGQSVPPVLYFLVFVEFALSAAQMLSGVFVWQGRSWARSLAIVLCSVSMIGALVSLSTGSIVRAISGFAINVALIRLLNNDEVQDWCSR